MEEDFPRGTRLSALDQEREAHQAFAEARRRVYVGGSQYFAQLDAYVEEHRKSPLVILGESGKFEMLLIQIINVC